MREHEWKADVPGDFVVPDLAGWETLQDDSVVLTATYWDTADLRLLSAGHTLRRRTASDGSEDGWTLKLARADHGGDGTARDEIDDPSDADHPPRRLLDLVQAVLRRESVRPVAGIRTRRHRCRLRAPDSQGVVELADDRVTTTVDGRRGPAFRQLEAELAEGDHAALAAAVRLLRAAGAESSEQAPKLQRALKGRAPAPALTVPELDRRATVEDLVRAALAGGARRLLAHDPGVRLGDDPEDVHQARVATRRLRSDLRTLAPLLDDFRVQGLRQELKWLGVRLGAVRDLDVLAARLRRDAEGLPDDDWPGAERLLERLADERHEAALLLRDVMVSSRYGALVESLHRLVRQPPLRSDLDPAARARGRARRLLRRADRRVRRLARRLGTRPPETDLHELRKRAKGARYAAELVAPLAPGRVARMGRRMADLQDVLGTLQDTVVADEWLRRLRTDRLSDGEASAAARLRQAQAKARAKAHRRWRKAWRAASPERVRRW
jgi:CHAD domain-containing protein